MADGPAVWYYTDSAGEWRWSLLAANNEIVADSAEGYTNKAGAQNGFRVTMRLPADPSFHIHDQGRPRSR